MVKFIIDELIEADNERMRFSTRCPPSSDIRGHAEKVDIPSKGHPFAYSYLAGRGSSAWRTIFHHVVYKYVLYAALGTVSVNL